jgi:serine/threonine protein kinase
VVAPERFGPYLLLDRINVGGMAEVFRGKQVGVEGFERLVALKRILPQVSSDPDFIEMFVDEAKIAVQLQHANIAQTYDLGKVGDQYYIALEYVSGLDLRTVWDRARKRKRLLPIPLSLYIVQKICEGLDAAHRKTDDTGRDIGLVHRDASPHNVLVSFEGDVKIIDFGIAKVANKISKTHAGALKGKFGYMSPEQIRGIDIDRRSDVFTVGTVLYELCVGRRLFRGNSDFSVLEKIRRGDVRPPSALNPKLDPRLEAIVMRALKVSRDERYQWAGDLAEDLNRYVYESDLRCGRADVARYMQHHFQPELEAERARLERYRAASTGDVEAETPPAPDAEAPIRRRPGDDVRVGPARSNAAAGPTVRASVAAHAPAGPNRSAASDAPMPAEAGGPQTEAASHPHARGNAAPGPAAPTWGPASGPWAHAPASPHEARPLAAPLSEGTAPWIGHSQSAVVRPTHRLPTWAAMLIGALAVVALGALAALGWVLTQDGPDVPVIREADESSAR